MKKFTRLVLCALATGVAFSSARPLPRFASLRSNAAHLHVGPGNDYPIEWKFTRKNFPVEITAEFDNWRRVRDYQGTSGWVHKSLLSGKRFLLVVDSIQNMLASPDKGAKIVARLEPGVVVTALEARPDWCLVELNTPERRYKGWVLRKNLWGTYAYETNFK